jgi:HEAT repeat protein
VNQDLPVARTEREGSTPHPDVDPEPPIPHSEIGELLLSFDKAARAGRLYAENNPMYHGFISSFITVIGRLWDRIPSLTIHVEEHGFRCYARSFAVGEGRESLPFQFYKDGIRVLTFLPGFEDEAERFLRVVNAARQMDTRSVDDLVTLLWEQEFTAFQYSYVDALAEGFDVPEGVPLSTAQIEPEKIAQEVQSGGDPEETAPAVQQGMLTVAATVTREDFEETLYFLEQEEMEYMRQQVELEWTRDTKAHVLDALFDRLEDPIADRQLEILRILRQLMPAYLGRGDLLSAARILEEVNQVLESKQLLSEEQRKEAQELIRALSDTQVLGQLLSALEDGSIDPGAEELSVFLANLSAEALPLLIRSAETTEAVQLRKRLRSAIEGLGKEHPRVLIGLVGSEEAPVALGAGRLAGQLQLTDAAPHIASLFRRVDAAGRRVAIEALVLLKSSISMAAAQEALEDEDREVRIAAARGLAGARYQPARPRLEALISGRTLREADLTEQIAFFEAFGAVASADGVKMLDRLLNGRRLLGKETPEIRACAAMALGKVGTAEARKVLQESAQDPHPMVRSAVTKALTGEGSTR